MAQSLPPLEPAYAHAIRLIDEAHAQDPNKIDGPDGPATLPYEVHYARSMTKWLQVRCPSASPELQLACRAQHFRRWEIPRSSFPMTRAGYLTWRAKQKSQAAQRVSALLETTQPSPIPAPSRDRVAALIRKEDLAADPETQALEDVACLVFLDDQFDAFEQKEEIDEDKVVNILRKTWAKMAQPGRDIALGMELGDRAKVLIGKALQPPEGSG
ncbi:hypothetical protein S40285_05183 [Stachybotrys chlorohalonatus IBT 40285]|uniref:Glutamyl-tRNA synthetase n=1 Tax=Stachybotrys chlorohalonatus (strain IBT 40285) TaxID=1283841 RepID=A0A084QF80_STAC4|nr:hypothetical protein S40285_05183 [Stachybotrys chlorohalonata IBT 40285]